MKFGVVVFPGSTCEKDCFYALKEAMKQEVRYIWHTETSISDVDCIVLPGGFSYGDYLRAGAISAQSPVMKEVKAFADDGNLVIGICNGFQILLESGLLPGAMGINKNLQFICKMQKLIVETTNTPFTYTLRKGDILNIPIAHKEGNYYIPPEGLRNLKENDQIVLRYYKDNPNGSIENIAGITNINRNVFGLMPHPERAIDQILGSADGLKLWKSVIEWKAGR